MVSLREARGSRTQQLLARLIRTSQSEISRWETGEKMMSAKSAEKLAEHLPGVSAAELRFENQVAAMKRAMRDGNPEGVLSAAKTIIKLADKYPMTAEGERQLDKLVSGAIKFAKSPHLFDFDEYGDTENRAD